MKTIGIIAAAAAVLVVAGCTVTVEPARVLEETVAIAGDQTLSVVGNVGSIDITGTSRSDVSVTAYVVRTTPVLLSGAVTPLDEVRLSIDASDGIVISHVPFDTSGLSVSYEIEVPRDFSIDTIVTGTGSIALNNVTGNPHLLTSTGSIAVDGLDGELEAQTSTGSITARNVTLVTSLISSTGSITAGIQQVPVDARTQSIRTSTGSISLFINPNLRLSILAETATGSIFTNGGLGLEIRDAGDCVEARLNGGGTCLSVSTGTGSISLYRLD